MLRKSVTLNDKYTEKSGQVYLNGLQALVRLPMIQKQLDAQNGLNTGSFISGYRGSPLGGLDIAFQQAKKFWEKNDIVFHPGVNEDLGATAVWGSQQLHLNKQKKIDGVVGIWYGKGPGVDRSMDVLKHANAAGTAPHGGVLALAGDDHACKSSTFPHQSEQAFIHAMIPAINPAGIGDALDLGLHAIAMSRYSGCWAAMKIISDMADSSATVVTDPFAMEFKTPEDFELPPGGLNIRWYDPPVDQEARLVNFKLPAVQAYVRANRLDKTVFRPAKKMRLGIVATGKAYMDTLQALEEMGLTPEDAEKRGIGLYKVSVVWPLEQSGVQDFARGADEILVIEEKRSLIENQLKEALYHMPADKRPRVCGKSDEKGAPLLADIYELSPAEIVDVLAQRISVFDDGKDFAATAKRLKQEYARKFDIPKVQRIPHYCSGCPHNTSTKVPEGSRALAGIGCHYMAMWMDRDTEMFTQMGGEGVPWIGQAPFTDEKHVFVNLGDGTYFHSGLLAIRAALAANVNITYKILYNDAVAMTGGQHVDGVLTVPMIARQVESEGVKTIIVMSDEPEKYPRNADFPSFVEIEHRDDLDAVQKRLRETEGVSVLIYDQTCAAEKRRRRKRGLMEDPAKRTFINEKVCEGCGDCSVQSNCLSILPVETEFGRKRQIDQSTCNKDFSCVKGFCPSFVTVYGGGLRKPDAAGGKTEGVFSGLPEPKMLKLEKAASILVTGIGGTGVVTIGAILAMAAHLEDKGATTMDQTGLAQKGGAVTSHVRIAPRPEDIHTVRIDTGSADAVIGCDLLVTADGDALSRMRAGKTKVVMNIHQSPTGDFSRNPDWAIPFDDTVARVRDVCGEDNLSTLDATTLATRLLGDSIATNMFMLGCAWQQGLVPVTQEAVMQALELNGVAVEMNKDAFLWGRLAAHDMDAVKKHAFPETTEAAEIKELFSYRRKAETLDEMIARRVDDLVAYQNADYAADYQLFVEYVREAEHALAPENKTYPLTRAAARYAYKLMAYKDEYEVARLYTDGAFEAQLKQLFEGGYKIKFNLAPPLLAGRDPETGHLRKKEFGAWIFPMFRLMAKMRGLRGTKLDIFGYTKERRTERRLAQEYRETLRDMAGRLTPENYVTAIEIAELPEQIRGYGHVKEANIEAAEARRKELLARFNHPEKTGGGDPEEDSSENTAEAA
ncbi:MAG: indolepyruvate ferredoxin oxidoreductase family protein [Micavibrio sp.]|nr:MAG: indolepyruvate ferredoxin oxidoreductase family protein [Micavibrio sp.]